jgi:hypothetical protein
VNTMQCARVTYGRGPLQGRVVGHSRVGRGGEERRPVLAVVGEAQPWVRLTCREE